MENKVIVSKTKDDMGQEEWWCNWFRCKNCKENWIYCLFEYCPKCGLKIEWTE